MFVARAARRRLAQSASCSSALTRSFSVTSSARADFTHVVVGGGVVGLATARALQLAGTANGNNNSTLLVERHAQVGTETSSRNSEVIHAGIYYGADSLKTRLCIEGRQALYDFCARHNVGHQRVGKWIVAQDAAQRDALQRIHDYCRDEIGVPVNWVADEEARRLEPDVRACEGVLESPTTGIVDSHGLILTLLGHFENAGGVTAVSSRVIGIEAVRGGASAVPGSGGFRITVQDASTGEESTVETETLINCAGLGAVEVHNMIAPPDRQMQLHYAKGNYFSYSASSPKVSRLIYPAPTPGLGGLGTHLTLDLAGRLRFGPDVEWVEDPTNLAVNTARFPEALLAIREYLPSVDENALTPDYAGIRPKLGVKSAVASGKGFLDFYIKKEDGFEGWVNLLGIESPGLTSSLAIGDMVRDILYRS